MFIEARIPLICTNDSDADAACIYFDATRIRRVMCDRRPRLRRQVPALTTLIWHPSKSRGGEKRCSKLWFGGSGK
jgi:hypothetical protein